MAAHAILGPSSAKRWMTCTPSARFSEKFENTSSEYANEGTAAHEYAEIILSCDTIRENEFRETNKYYDGEMEEAVKFYTDIVLEKFHAAKKEDPAAILMLEQKLDLSEYIPEGFGTGDAVIIHNNVLEVIDLKYGKGIPVRAKDNPQLKIYGLGAYGTFSMIYDIDTVITTIIQPRLDSITTDTMSVDELLEWAEKEVKPKAELAWKGEGEYMPGEHCQFCRGKNRCKALADKQLEIAKYEFKDPNILTDDDIVDILNRVDDLTKWASNVKKYALEQSENHGKKWPGYKLVEGRSTRKISDPDKLVKVLSKEYDPVLLYKPKEMLGITALEKLVGKKHFIEVAGKYIVKPPGKPTLVPETDKRPEINTNKSAQADFK